MDRMDGKENCKDERCANLRRKDLEVTGRETIESILQACKVCRIAMISEGKPYILPMVFGYEWEEERFVLYLHCGLKGRKNDALRACPQVCFEMDREEGLMGEGGPAHRHSRAFSCIIGEGTVEFAENNDQRRYGFDRIMEHQTGRSGWSYVDAYLAATEVLRIRADSFQASQKRPQRHQAPRFDPEEYAFEEDISHG